MTGANFTVLVMRNKISFFVLSNSGSPVKQFTLSKSVIILSLLLVLASISALAYGITDYLRLKNTVTDARSLERTISRQHEEIIDQRRQISTFAKQFNGLKSKLLALGDFERKIRSIANIEDSENQEGFFGVGGPMPEDLDTRLSLQESHDSLLREMHQQTQALSLASVHQERQFQSLVKFLEDQVDLLASTPAIRPAQGLVTCGFGNRKSPFTGLKEFHKGIDIANRKGTSILATADGIVTFSGPKGFLGKTIIVDHGHGMVTRYGHARELLVEKGEKVKRGDIIALVGNTGRTTGSHVHYEVMLNGMPVNPKKYILN